MELIDSDSDSEPDVSTDVGDVSEEATNLSEIMTEVAEEPAEGRKQASIQHDDDDFKVDWIDTLDVPTALIQPHHFPDRHTVDGPLHRWKGVDWSLLLLLRGREVGVYLGVNDPRQLVPGTSFNLKFQTQLVDRDDKVVCEGNDPKLHPFIVSMLLQSIFLQCRTTNQLSLHRGSSHE
jgi:hypothetical protein